MLEEGGKPALINHFVLTEFAIGLTEPLAQRVIVRLVSRVSLQMNESLKIDQTWSSKNRTVTEPMLA